MNLDCIPLPPVEHFRDAGQVEIQVTRQENSRYILTKVELVRRFNIFSSISIGIRSCLVVVTDHNLCKSF